MTRKTNKSTFCHPIYFNSFDNSIETLFQKLSKEGLGNLNQRIIPLIIQLNIPTDMTHEDIHVMRLFLKKLRIVHQDYFVRFRTNLLWAAESDNTDIFYTTEVTEDRHTDCILHLKVFDKKTIIANAEICKKTKRSKTIDNLQKTMLNEIPLDSIAEFYMTSGIPAVLKCQGDDTLHVFFISGCERFEFHPLPLYGFNATDAKCRYVASEKSLDFLSRKHQIVIPDRLDIKRIIEALLEIIQTHVDHGDRYTLAKEVYSLTELLYSYHLVMPKETKIEDRNELLVFDIIEKLDKTTTIQVYSIDHQSTE